MEEKADNPNQKYQGTSDAERLARTVVVKSAGQGFLDTLNKYCQPSRETSLAITKLEEAVMWAVKSIDN